jgi:hypothetical protein
MMVRVSAIFLVLLLAVCPGMAHAADPTLRYCRAQEPFEGKTLTLTRMFYADGRFALQNALTSAEKDGAFDPSGAALTSARDVSAYLVWRQAEDGTPDIGKPKLWFIYSGWNSFDDKYNLLFHDKGKVTDFGARLPGSNSQTRIFEIDPGALVAAYPGNHIAFAFGKSETEASVLSRKRYRGVLDLKVLREQLALVHTMGRRLDALTP